MSWAITCAKCQTTFESGRAGVRLCPTCYNAAIQIAKAHAKPSILSHPAMTDAMKTEFLASINELHAIATDLEDYYERVKQHKREWGWRLAEMIRLTDGENAIARRLINSCDFGGLQDVNDSL